MTIVLNHRDFSNRGVEKFFDELIIDGKVEDHVFVARECSS